MGGAGGVGADQVVHGVAAGEVLLDQEGVPQGAQCRAGPPRGQPGERGRGRQADVGTGGDAQQREHRPLLGGQGAPGPGQHGGQAGGGIVVVEGVQAQAAQFGGRGRQRRVGVGLGVGGDDAQRQGESAAQPDDLVHRLGFGVHAVGADAVDEQGAGLGFGEHVQRQLPGAVPDDQAGQPAAAGHQHGAGPAAWQQRGELAGVCGVVQHDQHAPVGHQAAEQRGLRVRVDRDAVVGHPEGVEEPAHRHGRVHRFAVRAEAPQVREQLPVGEPVEPAVGPVQGEPGLADPAGAADGEDDQRLGVARGVQPGQFPLAADERRGSGGQLAGH